MKKLASGFYLKYAWNAGKKDQFRKWIVVLICAAAIAFAAIGLGNFGDYVNQLHSFIKNVSERELVVFNHVFAENQFDTMNLSIPASKTEQIKDIPGVEQVSPLLMFSSKASALSKVYYNNGETNGYEFETTRVNCVNEAGLKKESLFDITTMLYAEGVYEVLSYLDESKMERMVLYLDESVESGIYITEQFLSRLGLTPEDLNGLTITFDAWILTAQNIGTTTVTDWYNDGSVEESEVLISEPFSQKTTITAAVKGIVPKTNFDAASGVCIYMSSSEMQQILDDCPKDYDTMEYIIKYLKESYPDKEIEDFSEWLPNAYYILVESAEDVVSVKEEVEHLDPNFTVIYEYRDVESSIRIISENRNMMIYVSFVVLTVVLLLMALIYMSLIDRRRFEFAVLRANGMTKKEIRKIVFIEMLLQFSKIFIFSVGLAFLIYYVGRRWYAFQFDWMTVLWLFVISLGSIILPTIISLLFVNKFEPDQIMRN